MPTRLTTLLLLLTASSVVAEDWPQWRGLNRDGKATIENFNDDWTANPPKLLWTGDGLGQGYSSVSVADGVIYTTGNFDDGQSVIALSEDGGKELWRTPITESSPKHSYEGARCTPTVDGEHLYVVASSGKIACLTREKGDVVWSKDFKQEWGGRMMSGWGFSESPLVDGELVLCTPGGPDATIVALNKTTGDLVWKSAVPDSVGRGKGGAGYSSIVISHGAGVKQYVQLVGKGVIGVRASDGEFLWGYGKVANGTANIPTPIIDGDYVFSSSGYGTGAALLKLSAEGDGVKAKEIYFLTADVFQNHHGGMILDDGYVYAGHGHNNGFPICLELETGKVAWGGKIRGAGGKSATIVFVNDHIIYRYQTGEVALVKATSEDYELKGSFRPEVVKEPSWAHPVVANGKLYLREQDSLMCYDLTK